MGGGCRGQSTLGRWQHLLSCWKDGLFLRTDESGTSRPAWPELLASGGIRAWRWVALATGLSHIPLPGPSLHHTPASLRQHGSGTHSGDTAWWKAPHHSHLAVQVGARSLFPRRASFSPTAKGTDWMTPEDFASCSSSSEEPRGGHPWDTPCALNPPTPPHPHPTGGLCSGQCA